MFRDRLGQADVISAALAEKLLLDDADICLKPLLIYTLLRYVLL